MRAKRSWQPSVKTTIRNLRRGPGTRPLYQSLSRGKHGLGHLQRYLLEEMLNNAGDSWEGTILYAHEMPLLPQLSDATTFGSGNEGMESTLTPLSGESAAAKPCR